MSTASVQPVMGNPIDRHQTKEVADESTSRIGNDELILNESESSVQPIPVSYTIKGIEKLAYCLE